MYFKYFNKRNFIVEKKINSYDQETSVIEKNLLQSKHQLVSWKDRVMALVAFDSKQPATYIKNSFVRWFLLGESPQCTVVSFVSFLSDGFTTVINPPKRKLAKRTSVQCSSRGVVVSTHLSEHSTESILFCKRSVI